MTVRMDPPSSPPMHIVVSEQVARGALPSRNSAHGRCGDTARRRCPSLWWMKTSMMKTDQELTVFSE